MVDEAPTFVFFAASIIANCNRIPVARNVLRICAGRNRMKGNNAYAVLTAEIVGF